MRFYQSLISLTTLISMLILFRSANQNLYLHRFSLTLIFLNIFVKAIKILRNSRIDNIAIYDSKL